MTNWKRKWDSYPRQFEENDFARQVESTIGGQPYGLEQIEVIVDRIASAMDLRPNDVVLDICCGNGLFTAKLAARVARIVAIDFSEPLLAIARRHHQPANVEYRLGDARGLGRLDLNGSGTFDKALMLGALQYFSKREFEEIIDDLFTRPPQGLRMLFLGSVLDQRTKWAMINSPQKKLMYSYYKLSGTDALGTFWHPSYIDAVSQRRNLDSEFFTNDHSVDEAVANFRFDAKIVRKDGA